MSRQQSILVVDDEPGIRSLYRMAFAHLGYSVEVARTGEEALELLATLTPALLVADLRLPGMSGIELGHKLSVSHPDLIKIAITGDIAGFGEKACREAGYRVVLQKPVGFRELLETSTQAMEARAP